MNSCVDDGFQGRIETIIRLCGSVAELSRKSHLSRGVIGKYQNGESDPSRSRLIALAQAAGVNVEWLATGEGQMQPSEDEGFRGRMEIAAKLAGNATRLAEMTGISRRAIGEYLAGKAEPSRPRLVAIAASAGVRVEWLATGEGPMRPGVEGLKSPPAGGIDRDLLAAIHKGVAEVYRSENARISADPLADEVARIYDDLAATYDSPDKRLIALDLALHQLRRELQAPATGGASRKQVS